MSNCFTCGKYFRNSEKNILNKFKDEYNKHKDTDKKNQASRFFYQTTKNAPIQVAKANIFFKEILPQIQKDGNFAHISEYAPKTIQGD